VILIFPSSNSPPLAARLVARDLRARGAVVTATRGGFAITHEHRRPEVDGHPHAPMFAAGFFVSDAGWIDGITNFSKLTEFFGDGKKRGSFPHPFSEFR
jgi:hypothetical protein